MKPLTALSTLSLGVLLTSSISLATAADISANTLPPVITRGGQQYSCKYYPGDRYYPSAGTWSAFNRTVNGNLQIAIPPGAPCHNTLSAIPTFGAVSTFNADQCTTVKQNFNGEQWTTDHPIAALWTFWTNQTCVPAVASPNVTCTRGYYGDYVVLAKTKQHIKATIDFARNNNIRLIIRNSGHDFMGRSVGFGSLVLNTHGFKDVEFTKSYSGPGSYRGGAVTVGAGIQGREMYRIANAQSPPLAIVGGECPTVGYAGGYIQGGGHGPFVSFHGMAADNVLSFDVVTASGQFVTANEKQNPDLFWALRGGGPSTFAAIVSVTAKTFPDLPSAAVILNINSTHTNNTDLIFKGFHAFHSRANTWIENGMFVYYELTANSLHIQPFVGHNMNASQINAIVKPLFDDLDAQGIPYSTVTKDFKTFFDLYIDVFEDERADVSVIVGGRVYTRQDITSNAQQISDAQRFGVENGLFEIVGHIVGPGVAVPKVNNAIHPSWRDAASFSITFFPLSGAASLADKAVAHNKVTNVIGEALRQASPKGFAYVSEGDLDEPNWQSAFWGNNYPRLYALKKVWDPLGVFYARTTPGTEDWDIIDDGTRLCRKV